MNQRTQILLGIAWLLFWLLLTVTAIQDFQRNGNDGPLWQPVLWEGSSALASTTLLFLQRHFTRRHDHLLVTPWRWFARQAIWLPVTWAVFVPLAFGIRHAVYALAGRTYSHAPWAPTFLYENVKITVFFAIFVVILFGVLSFQNMLQARLRAEQSNALLREAQLQSLTQQMQPHFLFNALNTVSSLMHEDVQRADATLTQLADMLRATLDASGSAQAPLATELRLLRGYAALMGERFADRVQIDWRLDAQAEACLVPVMSLQPLLENVFKHTVERRRGLTRISVATRRAGGMLYLAIEDDAGQLALAGATPPPMHGDDSSSAAPAAHAGGLGLRNLRARLQALYGEAATLELRQLAPHGVRAEIRLPCAC
ncbi:sensor histidine kinase [Massilia sp. NR 4-1]|uniref:sensor histidine kinase n=1 Tax=Massilia sp. NR 4-1 TaxID=1678028 RepID=UPI00067B60BC|nr:histidine kinase [Massilia sp. NR 4-1]AKU20562.1 sensor protein LytS [Massilia sp. NR 4-1]